MNDIEIINALKSFNLFSQIKDEDLIDIVNNLEIEQIAKGTNIINEGEYGDKIYFILEGIAETYIINKHGQETILSTLGKHNYFGELAFFTRGSRRSASVRAKTNCKLAFLSFEKFKSVLYIHPDFKDKLIDIMSLRINEMLGIITKKEKNIIIIMICSDNTAPNVQEFERYLAKLAQKPIINLDGDLSQNKFKFTLDEINDNYVLLKVKATPSIFLQNAANYIINFIENSNTDNGYNLAPGASLWKIQNTVRRITKKTIGIALSSGGIPACAHIGVLKVLQEADIPIDYIVGTSAGALIGGCFAFNGSTEKILDWYVSFFSKNTFKRLLALVSYFSFSFKGIFKHTFLTKLVTLVIGDKKIEEAVIPFAAVASDLFTGDTVVLDKGSVIDAINISNAAVIFSEPARVGDKLLIDGAATAPLPVNVLIDKHIDIKIVVPIPQLDLMSNIKSNSKFVSIYMRARSLMLNKMMNDCIALADIIIAPEVGGIHMDDSTKLEEVVRAGESAARLAIRKIQYLLNH